MFRFLGAAIVLVAASLTAQAHFLFIVADAEDAAKAIVVFSDDLSVDDAVTMDKVGGLKLQVKDSGGKLTEAKIEKDEHNLNVSVPGSSAIAAHRTTTFSAAFSRAFSAAAAAL